METSNKENIETPGTKKEERKGQQGNLLKMIYQIICIIIEILRKKIMNSREFSLHLLFHLFKISVITSI